jgi:hypothetical protein
VGLEEGGALTKGIAERWSAHETILDLKKVLSQLCHWSHSALGTLFDCGALDQTLDQSTVVAFGELITTSMSDRPVAPLSTPFCYDQSKLIAGGMRVAR